MRQLREACLARAGIDVRFLSGMPALRRAAGQLDALVATERLLVLKRLGTRLVPVDPAPAVTRILVPPSIASGSSRDQLRALDQAGAQVRVSARAVRRLAVVNRSVAVADLSSRPSSSEPEGVQVHNGEIVRMLVAHFEDLWRRAAPLSDSIPPTLDLFTPRQRQLLELLAKGFTDEMVSREMDLSQRSVRGEVAAIREVLGAASRFEAGVKYAIMMAAHGPISGGIRC